MNDLEDMKFRLREMGSIGALALNVVSHLGATMLKHGLGQCESPIEIQMLIALRATLPREVEIRQQVEIGPYRVDFIVGKDMVIECDGHDFHERTAEQATADRRRDRQMIADGWKVFRFTGSEIFRDPAACAREIAGYVEQLEAR